MEPLNKGHFGSGAFALYLEAVLWWEVRITIASTIVISIGAIAGVLYISVLQRLSSVGRVHYRMLHCNSIMIVMVHVSDLERYVCGE